MRQRTDAARVFIVLSPSTPGACSRFLHLRSAYHETTARRIGEGSRSSRGFAIRISISEVGGGVCRSRSTITSRSEEAGVGVGVRESQESDVRQLEDALGIAVGSNDSADGRFVELARLAGELVESSGPGGSGPDGVCPADRRIESFLNDYFADAMPVPPLELPAPTLVLPRHGIAPRAVAPGGRRQLLQRVCPLLPRAQRRAAQPAQRPPHHRRARSTSPRAACRFPATRRPSPLATVAALFRHAVAPPADLLIVPFTADRPAAASALRLAAAAADRLPRGSRRLPAEDDGDPLLRPGQPGQQPRFRRVDLRQRRRPVPARERRRRSTSSTGPATPAASSSPRT